MPETTAEFTFAQLAVLFPEVRCAPAGGLSPRLAL